MNWVLKKLKCLSVTSPLLPPLGGRQEGGAMYLLILLCLLLLPCSLRAEEEILREKKNGRWMLWDHHHSLGEDLRGLVGMTVLYSGGSHYNLSFRGPGDSTDGTVAVMAEGSQNPSSLLWGVFSGEESDLSLENIRRVRFVRGPGVIKGGQGGGLFGVVVMEEESPSEMEDFYLIRTLFGTNHLQNPFIRIGGYGTDLFAFSASYEHSGSHGAEGRGVFSDDFTELSRFSLRWDGELSDSLRIGGYLRGLEGRMGIPSGVAFLGGKRNLWQVSHGSTARWIPKKKIEIALGYGLQIRDEKIRGDQDLYLNLYGERPFIKNQRIFGEGRIATKGYKPLIFGQSTEFSFRTEEESVENPALGAERHTRLLYQGYLSQERNLGKVFSLLGILGWETSSLRGGRLSGGGEGRMDLYRKKHFIGAYLYRHYRRASWASLKGRFLNSGGTVALQGQDFNGPERAYAYGLEYRGEFPFLRISLNLFYHELLDRLYPRPDIGAIATFQKEPEMKIWGGEIIIAFPLTSEWLMEGAYSFRKVLPGLRPASRPPVHQASFQITYRASSESFFRGWALGLRLRLRDRTELWDFSTGTFHRAPVHLGLDLQLKYGYHGFGDRLEFLFHFQDILTGDHLEDGASPFNNGARPLQTGRVFWAGLRVSL